MLRVRWPSASWAKKGLGQGRFLGAVPVLLLLAVALPPPNHDDARLVGIPSLCTIYNLTGLPCPGCGITRSVVCAAHGQATQAFRFHPLGPLVFAALVVLTAMRLVGRFRPGFRVLVPISVVLSLPWVGVASLLGIWGARLAGVIPSPP